MLIKINKKPIHVTESPEQEQNFSWVYLAVSTCGYILTLALLDYSSYIFIGKHILPFLSWITNLFI